MFTTTVDTNRPTMIFNNMSVDTDSWISDNTNDNGTHILNNTVVGRAQYSTFSSDITYPRLVNGVINLLLLILTLSGNTTVFYVYRFRVKQNVFSFYVTVLASLDIITALTAMLMDVIIKLPHSNALDISIMCKIAHFHAYSCSLISGCVFTLIAYQRYRKICHPLEPDFKMRTAKISLVVMAIVCVPLSIPTLVINGQQDVQIKLPEHVVNLTICRYDQTYKGTYLQIAFSIFLSSAFTLVLCLTILFYVMVAKALRKFERESSIRARKGPVLCDINMVNIAQGYTVNHAEGRPRQDQQRPQPSRMPFRLSRESNECISTQMYRIFATITFIFVVSYLPHLVVLIVTQSLKLENQTLTITERMLLDLAYSSAYISNVANPLVYGCRNAEFREQLKQIFTCRK